MVQNKKKLPAWLAILGAALSGYVGYLLNGAWKPGQDLNAFWSHLTRCVQNRLQFIIMGLLLKLL